MMGRLGPASPQSAADFYPASTRDNSRRSAAGPNAETAVNSTSKLERNTRFEPATFALASWPSRMCMGLRTHARAWNRKRSEVF
jgi:hypothetical protein